MNNKWNNLLKVAVVLVVSGVMTAATALTPAGTVIRNQASARYKIGDTEYTSTSNEVMTEVRAIYNLDLLLNGEDVSEASNPVVVQHAYVGNDVYFQYEVRSYSNTRDTIDITQLVKDASSDMPDPSQISVYEDANGNGAVDPGEQLLGVWDPASSSWSSVSQDLNGNGYPDVYVDMNSSKFFVVTYTIPSGASDGQKYILGVTVQSGGNSSVQDPGTSESGNNYHEVVVTTDASIWANKTATPQQVAQGDTITYTISGSNVGGQATDTVSVGYDNDGDDNVDAYLYGVILRDGVDTSLVYFAGDLSGTPSGHEIYFYDANNDGTSAWHDTPPSSDSTRIDSVGYVFPNIDPGQQFTFTFKVKVRDNVAADTSISNVAVIRYKLQSGTDTSFTTNNAVVTVNASGAYIYSVRVGPYNNPEASGGGATGNVNNDTAAVDIIEAGGYELDTITVKNIGNVADEYVLSDTVLTTGTENKFSSITFLHMDASTPIANNRISLDAGESMDLIVRISVNDTVDYRGDDILIAIKATSVNYPDSFNYTRIVIDSIVGLSVDIGNADGIGGSVNNSTVDSTTNPGRCVTFPLDVLNNSGVSDVYGLSYHVPNGWTVTFYADADSNGTPDDMTPITQVGPVAPGAEGHVVVSVCVPSNEGPGTNDINLIAYSTRDTAVRDSITNTVTVNTVCQIDIDPDRHGTGFPGGFVTYQHRVTNFGNTTVNVTINISSQRSWTYIILDSDGQNVINGSFELSPGADSIIYVRAFVPSNAAPGQTDVATIEATTGSCADTVTDVTDVIAGALQLTKWIMDANHDGVADDSSFSSLGVPYSYDSDSGTIYYRVHYKNISTDTVKSPIIYEPVPTNTIVLDGTAGGTVPAGQLLYSYSTDGGNTWSSWSTSNSGWPVDDITNIRFGIDRNNDNNITDDDIILPNESGYIEFKVKIE